MPRWSEADKLAILQRRQRVAEAYLRGLVQWQIAAAKQVDRGTVSRDLKAVRRMWMAAAVMDFNARKAQELAKIDHLEAVAWEAWERSCQNAETLHAETVQGRTRRAKETITKPDGTVETREVEAPLPDLSRASKTVKGQAGGPRLLVRIGWCVEKRRKRLGLRAGQKHEHEHGGTLTVEERRNRLLALLDSIRRQGESAAEGGRGADPGGIALEDN